MIDPKLLLEETKRVQENNKKRGFASINVSAAQSLLEERKNLLSKLEDLRSQANEIAEKIPSASAKDKDALKEEGKELKARVKELEEEAQKIDHHLETELRSYPNMIQDDVPVGDESKNKEIKVVGKKPSFDFKPKDHIELGELHGMIDIKRAAKVSGSRFSYLLGDAVRLEQALIQYALSVLLPNGFTPVAPPHIISTEAMRAMGYLDHGGEEEVYHLKNDDAVLIGTSEQAIGPMFMDEQLDGKALPLRFVGISPCYRREAGSYGKDVKGILRSHQFDKIEMFSFTKPEDSNTEHEFLLSMQEELMKGLKLPYRVMLLASEDTGAPSSKTFDIETWLPSQEQYRETHSTSNTTDYQTRRLKTRYKDGKEKGYAHALNGTAFAIGRILIAIMENNQQKDGSILVPEVLQPWMGKEVIEG